MPPRLQHCAAMDGDEPTLILARFTLAGDDCLVVELGASVDGAPGLAGILRLRGRSYGVVARPHPPAFPDPLERLTPRELEIATLVACGCCDKEVARRLGISCHTVGAHIARCFAKLGLHKRTELVARIAARIRE